MIYTKFMLNMQSVSHTPSSLDGSNAHRNAKMLKASVTRAQLFLCYIAVEPLKDIFRDVSRLGTVLQK